MQGHTSFQKFLSSFLIFSLLFSTTFQIPFVWFFSTIFAQDEENYNLVSLFVQQEIYSQVSQSVDTYARNIQNTLENTRTIIIPVPWETHPYNILSLNEKLYFEWYAWLAGLKWNSHLIGSVFIGDIALPVVQNGNSYEKTVFPYVDFQDKLYIYDEEKKIFSLNKNISNTPKAEIWHGFISPNTWDRQQDIVKINDFFEKNNDFYQATWNFDPANEVLDGKINSLIQDGEDVPDGYEPYVFYFDQIRETKAVRYVDYKAYQSYFQNIEDITYNRYSKQLADTLQNNYDSGMWDYYDELQGLLWTGMSLWWGIDTSGAPDIQMKSLINQTTKKFVEIFNESALWDMRKDVHNAWRYNSWASQVNVDMIPLLITDLDIFWEKAVKNVNDDLEDIIDNLVKNGLSRNIAIPTTFQINNRIYTNYLYWQNALSITNALQCSFYRGSFGTGQLTESHRWFNFNNIQPDLDKCQDAQTIWYWWGYSPLNLQNGGNLQLKLPYNPNNASVRLYDPVWAKQIFDPSKTPSPQFCFQNNLIIPSNSCNASATRLGFSYTFDEVFTWAHLQTNSYCGTNIINLNGQQVKQFSVSCGLLEEDDDPWEYNFKKISSYVEHKAPTIDTVNAQAQYMVSPNLPIDKDRYIDFISADNTYGKIEYPYLFRLSVLSGSTLSFDGVKNNLKLYLDDISQKINNLIVSKDPSWLQGDDLVIYNLLKTSPVYPSANIDLYADLLAKPDKVIEIWWETKTLSYIDTLVFALLWTNLKSVPAKYKFIFENYLSDQFWGNNYNFFLPNNKKMYEIAYLWAPGNGESMFIKLDPEDRWENPYTAIIQANQELDNYLTALDNGDISDDGALFKCAPPEWVPIWKWIPAVMCWLKDMLPPTITINEGNCWLPYMNFIDDELRVCTTCGLRETEIDFEADDRNRNWVPDVVENNISDIRFYTDAPKIYYNKTWVLEIASLDGSGSVLTYDNFSNISLKLKKLTAPIDDDNTFDASNTQTIFDINDTSYNSPQNRTRATQYLSFSDIDTKLNRWKTSYNFSSKQKEADAILQVTLTLKWSDGSTILVKQKDISIEIRWDLFYVSTHKLSYRDEELSLNSLGAGVVVSNTLNIFALPASSLSTNLEAIQNLSTSKEKLLISYDKKAKDGSSLAVAYPLTLSVFNSRWERMLESTTIQSASSGVQAIASLSQAGIYIIEIEDSTGYIVKKQVTLRPDDAVKISPLISTNLMESGWAITTHGVSIYDAYDNPASGELYTIEVNITWNSVVFDNNQKDQVSQVYDWYTAFRLKTTPINGNATLAFTLKDQEGTLIDTKTASISVVSSIDFDVIWLPTNLEVWNTYEYTLKIQQEHEQQFFNSRAYLVSDSNSIKTNQNYIQIQNGTATGSFSTLTKAGEKIPLEFKVEWLKNSIFKEVSILPQKAMKVALTLSKSKIEAAPWSSSILTVELKDRFNNIVWNDSSTQLNLEILPEYQSIISSSQLQKVVSKWVANFVIQWTSIPGTAFFKVSTSPNLSQNTFEIPGQSPFPKTDLTIPFLRNAQGLTEMWKKFFEEVDENNYRFRFYKRESLEQDESFLSLSLPIQSDLITLFESKNKLIVRWVWENVWKIETFYFWNISQNQIEKYNALYTTLLWSNYWDITLSNNLANSIIFDKNNRALWVTALLSDLTKTPEVFFIKPDGNIALSSSIWDISQDITSDVRISSDGNIEITFQNETFHTLVAKLYYNIKNPTLVWSCQSVLQNCFVQNQNSLVLQSNSLNYLVTENDVSWLRLEDNDGNTPIKIDRNGKISLTWEYTLNLVKNTSHWLVLQVKNGFEILATLWISLSNSAINQTRDIWQIPSLKSSQSNGWVIVYLEGRDYFSKTNFVGSSTKQDMWMTIAYNDPFTSSSRGVNQFWNYFDFWYENFEKQWWLGWKWDNKILLSFAAGKTLGESTKDFMSFGLINIWDPVISLKPIAKKLPGTDQKRKYDATIGALISKDEDTIDYEVFDYNNDWEDDIIVLKRDGYIELLEWTSVFWDFYSRGDLIYVPDMMINSPLIAGDFFGDGYGDIIVLDRDKQLVLFSNIQKQFTRREMDFWIEGKVGQIKWFDMDRDGLMDLVILDDLGNLYILYWSNSGNFVLKLVDSWLGITLSEDPRKDGGAVYYKWLYQISQNDASSYVTDSEALYDQFYENFTSSSSSSGWWSQDEINEGLVNKIVFTQMNYTPQDALPQSLTGSIFWQIPSPLFPPEAWLWDDDVSGEVEDFWNTYGNNIIWSPNSNTLTTFLKSEYSEYEWIEISKIYSDNNWWTLHRWDSVKLTLQIKNTTSQTLENLAYVEKVNEIFSLNEHSQYSLMIGWQSIAPEDILLQPAPSSEYTFLLDSYLQWDVKKYIELLPGQELIFTLTLTTADFTYGDIEVWFFDERNSDGDIIFKDKAENCGQEVFLYASLWGRNYLKIQNAPVCEEPAPDDENDFSDLDGNGIPDFIDNMLGNTGALLDYASWALNDFRNEMWISDDDDFMNNLDRINQTVEEWSAMLDTIMAWLSCWFWWGWCIATPLNWAPLAPGNDPTLFGMPIWDGLWVWEWLPIFAYPTTGYPPVWPPSPTWAWGWLDGLRTWLWVSQFRIFITPTLTWAIGIAICFGPNVTSGWQPMPWISPIVPGWNCIVAAKPLLGCSWDGSDGEIYNLWTPNAAIINGNCSLNSSSQEPYLWQTWWDYAHYKNTGNKRSWLDQRLKDLLSTIATSPLQAPQLPDRPLLNIGNWSNPDLSVNLDFWAMRDGNFPDILQIQMTRISPFPDFVMEWVTRQIEEIANKLTDFPTLFIILPDFRGVFDGDMGNFMDNLSQSYNSWEQQAQAQKDALQSQIDSQPTCDENNFTCRSQTLETLKLKAQQRLWANQTIWWIKWVYEFLSNMPIVKIEPQRVDVNIPWIDKTSIDKAIADFEITKSQWQEELARAQSNWSAQNYTCVETTSAGECKTVAQVQALIYSIERNIEILESYKNLPEELYKMLKIKDIWLEQILCNIETISKITWGWIGENGKRFKAWVELYVLIKAILKSWQLLVDVFIDYDVACHQCKNERYDLQYFIWKLISMILPKIPVIQFPKWPDIYLDLHNIRVDLRIGLPEFEFNLRPIILPSLPNLYLPDSPNISINIPSLPLLPELQLPELPELPSLPSVELPNLPPPPKLPKILSAIEAFLKILKLITKAMCILKFSPFVPEWRAWDQIAFITERSGYLWIDFLDVSYPQFSFPFVDAIKVSTYVNLDMDIDFLVEMARQAVLPINVFGSDIANMLNIGIGDIDLRGATPSDISIDLGDETGYIPDSKGNITLWMIAWVFAKGILDIHSAIERDSKIELSNQEFKETIASQLVNIGDEKLTWVWNQALNYSFQKENTLIQELLDNNTQKFQEIESIIQEQKDKNIQTLIELEQRWILWDDKTKNTLTSSYYDTSYQDYNTRLEIYKQKALLSLSNMVHWDDETEEIRSQAQEIVSQVKHGLGLFDQELETWKQEFETTTHLTQKLYSYASSQNTSSQLAQSVQSPVWPSVQFSTPVSSSSSIPNPSQSCNLFSENGSSYIYKWIYIIETALLGWKKISYYLMDYLDELTWYEKFKEVDFDNDWDEDIIYMMGNEIYLKKNFLSKNPVRNIVTTPPIILSSNRFISGNFLPFVNNFKESVSDNRFINFEFESSYKINNYRVEFTPLVDKFDDIIGDLNSYTPVGVKKHIIDVFSDIDTMTENMERSLNSPVTSRDTLAFISEVWSNLVGVKLRTPELIDISQDIAANTAVVLNAGTPLYSGDSNISLMYEFTRSSGERKTLSIPRQSNITFKEDVRIIGINGSAYIQSTNSKLYLGNQIADLRGKPFLPGTTLSFDQNEMSWGLPYITLRYFDGTQAKLDFREISTYALYDVWRISTRYFVRSEVENGFYYARMQTFKNNEYSSYGNQVLFSPQKWSDLEPPQISQLSSIQIPVYSQKTFDISENIFENSGNANIKDIYIDFDLWSDSDGDGNKTNDRDFVLWQTAGQIQIQKTWWQILLKAWPFDTLINKPIKLFVVDENKNIWSKEVTFQVYAPIPRIEDISSQWSIVWRLDEDLWNEPVAFYRLRNNELLRLTDRSGNTSTDTIEWGKFIFPVDVANTTTLWLTASWSRLFNINETTGRISFPPTSSLRVDVLSSNHTLNTGAYPLIQVKRWNELLYEQYLAAPNSWQVEVVESLWDISWWVWVYYNHNSVQNYSYVSLPVWIERNAWDLYIYLTSDPLKRPIAIVYKDGRIHTSSGYDLRYNIYDNYVQFDIAKSESEIIIGRVIIIPEQNFVVE